MVGRWLLVVLPWRQEELAFSVNECRGGVMARLYTIPRLPPTLRFLLPPKFT